MTDYNPGIRLALDLSGPLPEERTIEEMQAEIAELSAKYGRRKAKPESVIQAAGEEYIAAIKRRDSEMRYRPKPKTTKRRYSPGEIPAEYADCPFEYGTDDYLTWCSMRSDTTRRVRR